MKKGFAIVIIFIALTNIVGFMPVYFWLLQEIKSEVRLKIADEGNLEKLEISKSDYDNPAVFSMRGDDEFSYKGQMYDFKKVQATDLTYTFYAITDNKESGLINLLDAIFNSHFTNDKSAKAPLANLFKNFSKDFIGSFSIPHVTGIYITNLMSVAGINGSPSDGYSITQPLPPDMA